MKIIGVYVCECCAKESVLCKHCGVMYSPTTENFYTSHGKLKLDKCKACKKIQSREYEKDYIRPPRKNPRDRTEYMKKYREKKRMEKKTKKETEA